MIRRKKQSRMYHAPTARVTQMALESNFCQTLRFNVQVKELDNMNDPNDSDGDYNGESFYFES